MDIKEYTYGLIEFRRKDFSLIELTDSLDVLNTSLDRRLKEFYDLDDIVGSQLQLIIFRSDSSKPTIDNINELKLCSPCVIVALNRVKIDISGNVNLRREKINKNSMVNEIMSLNQLKERLKNKRRSEVVDYVNSNNLNIDYRLKNKRSIVKWILLSELEKIIIKNK
jgi:hypothetical protein